MENLSEVLKILEGALQHNVRKAADYAGLLADKLEEKGELQQAKMLRQKISKAPQDILAPAGLLSSLPVDSESQLYTLDEERVLLGDAEIVLPDNVSLRIDEFVKSISSRDKLLALGLYQPSRLLFYGPPGCGKTQATRYISAKLGLPILTVRCDTLVSSLLGQTSKNLRRVFDYVSDRPCVLFLDELDALAKSRTDEREIGELQRVVISLLQNIDAVSPETIIIAATNHDELLDKAVWRRFAWHIPLTLPDSSLRERIWKIKLRNISAENIPFDLLSDLSDGLSGAAIEQVASDSMRNSVLQGASEVDLTDLLCRLGLSIAMSSRVKLDSQEKEIAFLRDWCPRHLSLRKLAKHFNLSVRQIDKAAKGDVYDS